MSKVQIHNRISLLINLVDDSFADPATFCRRNFLSIERVIIWVFAVIESIKKTLRTKELGSKICAVGWGNDMVSGTGRDLKHTKSSFNIIAFLPTVRAKWALEGPLGGFTRPNSQLNAWNVVTPRGFPRRSTASTNRSVERQRNNVSINSQQAKGEWSQTLNTLETPTWINIFPTPFCQTL